MHRPSQRLLYRHFRNSDSPFLFELMNSPGWIKNIGDRQIKSPEHAANYIKSVLSVGYLQKGMGFYLVERLEDHTPLGLCGIYKRDYLPEPDLGYALLHQFEKMGYALEACNTMLYTAKNELGLSTICAFTLPSNASSLALLKKLGFRFNNMIQLPGENEWLELHKISL